VNFRIADTFTDSLARLTGEEQKAVKTTAFDLQLDPAAPGLGFHKLDKAKDRNFWSVRVSRDIREIADADGNSESRGDSTSVFNGAPPVIQTFAQPAAELAGVGSWLAARVTGGVAPHEIGVFVRSDAEIARARAAVEAAGVPNRVLDERVEAVSGFAAVGTMHLAKGLEFRTVVVMACDDEVIPLQARIETVGEDADLKEVYDTERQLLYVACTRARDFLMVSGVEPASDFLEDMKAKNRATDLN
jgi:superfamily I DNA/RNA helicase